MKQPRLAKSAVQVLLGTDPSASEDRHGSYSTVKANYVAKKKQSMQHASPTVTRLPHHTKWTSPAMAWLDKPTLHEYQSTILVQTRRRVVVCFVRIATLPRSNQLQSACLASKATFSAEVMRRINDVSVNDGPHKRRWSHKIIILKYNIIILTTVLQLPTVLSTVTCCTGL